MRSVADYCGQRTPPDVLVIIDRYAPRRWREHRMSVKGRYTTACPLPDHDDAHHPDGSGSFSIDASRTLFFCFGCGTKGNSFQLQHILGDGGYTPSAPVGRPRSGPARHGRESENQFEGITLAELCAVKGLNPTWVQHTLGWRDTNYAGVSAIEIPYRDAAGRTVAQRFRVGLTGDERFRWKRGSRGLPLGLDRLDEARRAGYVVWVEGETDSATLIYWGIPALGVPGAAHLRPEWGKYTEGVETVYVWQEPGRGGQGFAESAERAREDTRVIAAPAGFKDPTEMAISLGDGFLEAFKELMEEAVVPSPVDQKRETLPYLGQSPTRDDRADLADLFPLPRDAEGRAIRPSTVEFAMLKREDPRRGATHLKYSNTWQNSANATYRRRAIYGSMRRSFRAHLEAGGRVYQATLVVPTGAPDDAALLKEEQKEWDRDRKRLQRAHSQYRWLSTLTEDGAARVIFASEPIYDGQEPLADPEATLLDAVRLMAPLRAPYPKRDSHGGPDDTWKPARVENYEWVIVGSRPGHVIESGGQDIHDQAAAAAVGVSTWMADDQEVNGRAPEEIMRSRHWQAPAGSHRYTLFQLFHSVGFQMLPEKWDRSFGHEGEGAALLSDADKVAAAALRAAHDRVSIDNIAATLPTRSGGQGQPNETAEIRELYELMN